MILSVDPGLRGCGVALWDAGRLAQAAYVENPMKTGRGPAAYRAMGDELSKLTVWGSEPLHVVLELPRVYPVSKGDPNDLIDLAGVVGAIAGCMADTCSHYEPAQWKGQVPKTIMAKRILSKLSKAELDNVQHVGYKDHNTIDAIGIGLKYLGRL